MIEVADQVDHGTDMDMDRGRGKGGVNKSHVPEKT